MLRSLTFLLLKSSAKDFHKGNVLMFKRICAQVSFLSRNKPRCLYHFTVTTNPHQNKRQKIGPYGFNHQAEGYSQNLISMLALVPS